MSEYPGMTQTEIDFMEHVAWAMFYFDGAGTSRTQRKDTARRLAKKGMVKSGGLMHPCDGDGFVQEHRNMRECWVPTDLGWEWIKANTEWWKEYEELQS